MTDASPDRDAVHRPGGVWHNIGRQLRAPSGAGGQATGWAMRVLNTRPNALAVQALLADRPDRILELGCGPGHAIRLLARSLPAAEIFGIDHSTTMLRQAQARNRRAVGAGQVRFDRADFTALPFADGAFDAVLAVNVAYFWHDDAPILAEIRRVLRPGGRLVVYVTDAATMQRWKFADPATHRLHDRTSLSQMLADGGFRPTQQALSEVDIAAGIRGIVATATNNLS